MKLNGAQDGTTFWTVCPTQIFNGFRSWTHLSLFYSCLVWWQWFYWELYTKTLPDIIKLIVERMPRKNLVGNWFMEMFSDPPEKECFCQFSWDLELKFYAWPELPWWAKLYIPSTLNIVFILWHTQLIVCAVKCLIIT